MQYKTEEVKQRKEKENLEKEKFFKFNFNW